MFLHYLRYQSLIIFCRGMCLYCLWWSLILCLLPARCASLVCVLGCLPLPALRYVFFLSDPFFLLLFGVGTLFYFIHLLYFSRFTLADFHLVLCLSKLGLLVLKSQVWQWFWGWVSGVSLSLCYFIVSESVVRPFGRQIFPFLITGEWAGLL